MVVRTDTERVRLSRRLVLEFLASSVDVSTAPQIQAYMDQYGAHPERFGPAPRHGPDRDAALPGCHTPTDGSHAATVAQPAKIDNELYMRDYSKCILCYKCVEACGTRSSEHVSPLPSPAGASTRASPLNTLCRYRSPPASTAATASACAPRGR